MHRIIVLSSSVRKGRSSHRVAVFFRNFLIENKGIEAEIIDLAEYNFPIFEERLQYLESPGNDILAFVDKIRNADGILIVTPEYNGGYPAALKNVIDLLTNEWKRKPVAISTVSDGSFGGTQVITSLQFSLWKIKAWTIPAMFPVPHVDKTFTEYGVPVDSEKTMKRAETFVNELLWCIEAKKCMGNR